MNKNKRKRGGKNYYAEARGHTVAIFTSWSMCEASVNKYQGQLYKGFKDLDSAINFMSPFSYACTSVLIYDDLGNIKHAKDFGHSCTNNCTTGEISRHVDQNDNKISSESDKSNESEDENVNSEFYDACEIPSDDEFDQTIVKGPVLVQQNISNNTETTQQTVGPVVKSCNFCDRPDIPNMIQCGSCKGWVHFDCSTLPDYILYTLTTSTRKYTCKKCVVIPTNFSYTQEKVSKLKTDTSCISTQTTSNVMDHETLNETIINKTI